MPQSRPKGLTSPKMDLTDVETQLPGFLVQTSSLSLGGKSEGAVAHRETQPNVPSELPSARALVNAAAKSTVAGPDRPPRVEKVQLQGGFPTAEAGGPICGSTSGPVHTCECPGACAQVCVRAHVSQR